MRLPGLLLHVALHLVGERGHELVHGLLHLVHQTLDLFVRRAVGKRILQGLLEAMRMKGKLESYAQLGARRWDDRERSFYGDLRGTCRKRASSASPASAGHPDMKKG